MESEFIALRNNYMPENITTVFILESPPAGHGYFYDPSGRVSEVLFRAFMKLLEISPTTKEEGLQELSRRGWVLVNPIYTPVNKLPDKEADKLILGNYFNFKKDLDSILGENRSLPVILVKSNILRLLEKSLLGDGYNVINNGVLIPFPLHYHANSFHEKTMKLLKIS